MEYPIWNVPYVGGAMVVVLATMVQGLIMHFAVGAGLINALTETFWLKGRREIFGGFLRDNSRLMVLVPFTVGLVATAAMWFGFGLVQPETTLVLVRLFCWAWAMEGCFLLVQVVAGYLYCYSWERVSHRGHCLLGWVYVMAGFLSLAVLNGMFSFMLTPGGALDRSVQPMAFDFWAGIWNPTFWPSLIIRMAGAVALAALVGQIVVNVGERYDQEQKRVLTRYVGKYLLALVVLIPAGWWYWVRLPALSRFYLEFGSIAMTILGWLGVILAVLVGVYGIVTLVLRKRMITLETAVLVLVLAVMAAACGEIVREGMAKPWLIFGHIYGNGITKQQMEQLKAQGREKRLDPTVLQYSRWAIRPQDAGMKDEEFLDFSAALLHKTRKEYQDNYPEHMIRGRWIYDGQCLRCHAIDGYNAIRPLVHKWSPALLNQTLDELEIIKPSMPPFVGTVRDRMDLSYYMHGLSGRCTLCHVNVDDEGKFLPGQEKIELKDDWEEVLP